MTISTGFESMHSRHKVKPPAHRAGKYMSSKDFGERVLQARLRLSVLMHRKLSQSDVAEMVGVAQPTFGRWETGAKEPQDLATWERLAAVLRVNVEWLAFGRGAMEIEEPTTDVRAGVADLTDAELDAAEDAARREAEKRRKRRKRRGA
ncbi:MAG TPA: helix-turn-helix transcriptional regulator [Gemmatimonadaceae bacterium]|nr:helix-turn-helix transcriptional regulator [Gemmatimonadaceae bacterium]